MVVKLNTPQKGSRDEEVGFIGKVSLVTNGPYRGRRGGVGSTQKGGKKVTGGTGGGGVRSGCEKT